SPQVFCSPSPRRRPLASQACACAAVCQVKAVLFSSKGQLSSLPVVFTHSCFPAIQVCSWCVCGSVPVEVFSEQIFQNLRQEYSRIQRRRQLEGAFNQTEACSSSDSPSPSSSINAPSSPPGASRKDQPSFTLKQVSYLCERLLKDHEEKIREEYEQILNTKLAEQYESFVKFTQDQIMRRYGARPASYVS
uniref:Akirin 1 n=1 Tax=Gasterosteus aculeatus aculeatus TaxID=481459 RepID=A0AAQ4RDP2_GASAC